jgi:hypothetical protein
VGRRKETKEKKRKGKGQFPDTKAEAWLGFLIWPLHIQFTAQILEVATLWVPPLNKGLYIVEVPSWLFPFNWSFWHYSTAVPPTSSSSSLLHSSSSRGQSKFSILQKAFLTQPHLCPFGFYEKEKNITWVAINNRPLLITVLEAVKPQIKLPSNLLSGEGLPLVHRWHLLLCPHRVNGNSEESGVLYKSLMSFIRALPPTCSHLPNALPPNTITLEGRFSSYKRGDTKFPQGELRICLASFQNKKANTALTTPPMSPSVHLSVPLTALDLWKIEHLTHLCIPRPYNSSRPEMVTKSYFWRITPNHARDALISFYLVVPGALK